MALSTELARTTSVTETGVLTAVVYDKISVDQILWMLFKGSAGAVFADTVDNTDLVSREVKDLLVFPFSDL